MSEFVAFSEAQSALPQVGECVELIGAAPPYRMNCVASGVRFSDVADPSDECPNPPGVGYIGTVTEVTVVTTPGDAFHAVLVQSTP